MSKLWAVVDGARVLAARLNHIDAVDECGRLRRCTCETCERPCHFRIVEPERRESRPFEQ